MRNLSLRIRRVSGFDLLGASLAGIGLLGMGTLPIASRAAELTFYTLRPPFRGGIVGMNDSDEMVATGPRGGFVYRASDGIIDLLSPSLFVAINNRGEVLLKGPDRIWVPPGKFLLYNLADKTYRSVGAGAPTKAPYGGADWIEPINLTAFNDSGQFTGTFGNGGAYGTPSLGATCTPTAPSIPVGNGDFVKFSAPAGMGKLVPTAINNRGQIVGTCVNRSGGPVLIQGFLYGIADGSMRLFFFPGAKMTYPTGINDAGMIVGNFQVRQLQSAPPSGGFIYDGSQFQEISGAPVDKGSHYPAGPCLPVAINNHGDLAGRRVVDGVYNSFIAMAEGRPPPQLSGIYDYTATGEGASPPPDPLHRPQNYQRDNPRTRLTGADGREALAPANTAAPAADPNLPLGPGPSSTQGDAAQLVQWNRNPFGADATIPEISGFPLIFDSQQTLTYLGFNERGSWIRCEEDGWVYVFDGKADVLRAVTGYFDEFPTTLSNPSRKLASAAQVRERIEALRRFNLPDHGVTPPPVPVNPPPQNPGGYADLAKAVFDGNPPAPAPQRSASGAQLRGRGAAIAGDTLSFSVVDPGNADDGASVSYKVMHPEKMNMNRPASPGGLVGTWLGVDPANTDNVLMFTVQPDRSVAETVNGGLGATFLRGMMNPPQPR
jgi:hypothetical protein